MGKIIKCMAFSALVTKRKLINEYIMEKKIMKIICKVRAKLTARERTEAHVHA